MSSQNNTFKTSEEYLKTSSKWFSESAIAMADIYSKQFKLGYDMYTNLLHSGSTIEKNKSAFSSDLFYPNVEAIKKSIENIAKLSEKTISTIMNSYTGHDGKLDEGTKLIEAIMEGYHLQAKQISDINNRFFDAFGKTFNETNENLEKSYSSFRKNSEENFHKVEEAINTAIKTYSSSVNKSDKTRQELFDTMNNQMELLIKNSLQQWSDLTQTMQKENKKPEEKAKEVKVK